MIYISANIQKYQDSMKLNIVTLLIVMLESSEGKDHIYRMAIVEGRCTMARSSSLGANCSLVDS